MALPKEYTWETKIASFDADEKRQLRLSSQLKLQQEVGEHHLAAGGVFYHRLYEDGFVFVLTKASSILYRLPRFEEPVNLTTWSRGTKGIHFFRCYRFTDGDGNVLIDSITSFALVDAKTHKLLRPVEFDRYGPYHQPDKTNSCELPSKLKLPEGLTVVTERILRYSDIDYNGHLNNAVYGDFLCDYMPGGMTGKKITAFDIGFLHEAFLGDTIVISALSQGNTVFLKGEHDRGVCFEARCCYETE